MAQWQAIITTVPHHWSGILDGKREVVEISGDRWHSADPAKPKHHPAKRLKIDGRHDVEFKS